MKKYYFILIILVISTILIHTFFILYSKSIQLIGCNKELYAYKAEEAMRKEDFNRTLFSDGNILSNIKMRDQNNREIELKNIVEGTTLIYRFSQYSCKPCILNDIKILDQLNDSIPELPILILSDFKSPKEMRIFSSNNNLRVSIYSYIARLDILADSVSFERRPYYFLLDANLEVHFAYISNPEHTINDKYFSRILEYSHKAEDNIIDSP